MLDDSQEMKWKGVEGTATQPGVSHVAPASSSGTEPTDQPPVQHPHHGLPISLEEFERLKSRAAIEKPAVSSIGHQDSSVNSNRKD